MIKENFPLVVHWSLMATTQSDCWGAQVAKEMIIANLIYDGDSNLCMNALVKRQPGPDWDIISLLENIKSISLYL